MIAQPSFRVYPVACVLFVLSLPARSAKFNIPVTYVGLPPFTSGGIYYSNLS